MSNNKQITPLSSTISKVFGIAVLRSDGSRIYSKYYNRCFPDSLNISKEGNLNDVSAQKAFEKNIFEKSRKLVNTKAMKPSDTEIFGYGRFTLLFKILSDVQIYIIADPDENEGLLASVLKCITDCMSTFSKEQINNKIITDNFQGLILIIDEVIDQGVVVNIDSGVINARFNMIDCDDVQLNSTSQAASSSSSSNQSASSGQTTASSTVGFLKSLFNR